MGGRLLLDPGLTSGFEERLFVDHEEGVRSVTPGFTNDSPEARKDRPGCGSSVDGDEDEDETHEAPRRHGAVCSSQPRPFDDANQRGERRAKKQKT